MGENLPSNTGSKLTSIPFYRLSLCITVGGLMVSGLLAAIWAIVGGENALFTKTFLTVGLMVVFSIIVVAEAEYQNTQQWYASASLLTWVALLILGIMKTWWNYEGSSELSGFAETALIITRVFWCFVVVEMFRLALLFIKIIVQATQKHPIKFNYIIGGATIVSLIITVFLFTIPIIIEINPNEIYWRSVVAALIFSVAGCAIIPLVNAMIKPKEGEIPDEIRVQQPQQYTQPQYRQQPQQPVYQQPAPQTNNRQFVEDDETGVKP